MVVKIPTSLVTRFVRPLTRQVVKATPVKKTLPRAVKNIRTTSSPVQPVTRPPSRLGSTAVKVGLGTVAVAGGGLALISAGEGIGSLRRGLGFTTPVETAQAEADKLEGLGGVLNTVSENPFLFPIGLGGVSGGQADQSAGEQFRNILIIGGIIAGVVAVAFVLRKK